MWKGAILNKVVKRTLYVLTTITSLSGISVSGASAYWLYQNSSVELTSITKPDLTQKIVKNGEKTDGATYDGSLEVRTAEQVKQYRKDTSQPLYLRNYLSVPSLGINLQIYEGTSNRVLSYGAGTIKPNQVLDNYANYAIAAHNFSDAQWGKGFSVLQYQPDIYGKTAYVSDGEYVYSYTLAKREHIFRDESMKFTEDDYRQQTMQDEIKRLAPIDYRKTVKPDKIYNIDGSYKQNTNIQEFEYGKLLTFYTCEVEWNGGQLLSWNRFVITGVMIKKQKLSYAPKDVQNLFLDANGNLTVSNTDQKVPSEAKLNEAKVEKTAQPTVKNIHLKSKVINNQLQSWWNQQVAHNQGFPIMVVYVGLGMFLVSVIGILVLNRFVI